jgi:hypothetical protein
VPGSTSITSKKPKHMLLIICHQRLAKMSASQHVSSVCLLLCSWMQHVLPNWQPASSQRAAAPSQRSSGADTVSPTKLFLLTAYKRASHRKGLFQAYSLLTSSKFRCHVLEHTASRVQCSLSRCFARIALWQLCACLPHRQFAALPSMHVILSCKNRSS